MAEWNMDDVLDALGRSIATGQADLENQKISIYAMRIDEQP